ncbi:hypothetical protein HY488_02955, partial [Candidatus Woesearchaeota archaeon]|nr:hypothetical protein [Candidatus Woesearchaeota archaeon]
IFDKTGEEIGRGIVRGNVVPAQNVITLPFSQETSWLPTIDTLLSLASDKNVYVTLRGEAQIFVGGIPITGPFSERIDIQPLVRTWLTQKQRELMKDPKKALERYGITP